MIRGLFYKQYYFFVCVFLLSAGILGCGSEPEKNASEPVAEDVTSTVPVPSNNQASDTTEGDGHNASNSLDVKGRYLGYTPCADCDKIQVELMITTDSTYVLYKEYKGKPDAAANMFDGNFKWVDGNTIELQGLENMPNRYLVGEGTMTQLDMQGKKIQGKLADMYILRKQKK